MALLRGQSCPVRLCPLEQSKARPPSRSVEPKTGLVLSLRAAGLACPNYAADGSPRQQLARLRIRLVDVAPAKGGAGRHLLSLSPS